MIILDAILFTIQNFSFQYCCSRGTLIDYFNTVIINLRIRAFLRIINLVTYDSTVKLKLLNDRRLWFSSWWRVVNSSFYYIEIVFRNSLPLIYSHLLILYLFKGKIEIVYPTMGIKTIFSFNKTDLNKTL
jgi:hypothetical protein